MNTSFAPGGSSSVNVTTSTPQIAGTVTTLLNAVGVVSQGTSQNITHRDRRYTFSVAGTGAVTATVKLYVSGDNSTWVLGATVSLSGTGSDQYGFSASDGWKYVRADVTAISGTGAAVTATVQE